MGCWWQWLLPLMHCFHIKVDLRKRNVTFLFMDQTIPCEMKFAALVMFLMILAWASSVSAVSLGDAVMGRCAALISP